MGNKFYDPKLHDMCRSVMRNFLQLYFEFTFKIDADINIDTVAKTNDFAMELEDELIPTDRLLVIYHTAVMVMAKNPGGLQNFCLLPTLFLRDDIDAGEDMYDGEDSE